MGRKGKHGKAAAAGDDNGCGDDAGGSAEAAAPAGAAHDGRDASHCGGGKRKRDGGGGGAAAAAGPGGGKRQARHDAEAAEVAAVWRQIGDDLGVPSAADAATRQAALLRWVGFAWRRDGALTARPQGLRPSPLRLDALPAVATAAVLAQLCLRDRFAAAAVCRAWHALVAAPDAWACLRVPFAPDLHDFGGHFRIERVLSMVARLLYKDDDAALPGVQELDLRERSEDDEPTNWGVVATRCPSLRVLRCGYAGERLFGSESGPDPETLLELLAERPGLRAPEAHVLLRGPPGGSAVVAHLARRPVAALAALLEERRCSVASLTLRLPTALLSDEDAAALAELLVSPAAASLRALDLSSCVRTAAAAAALARAIARAPNIRFVRVGDSEANLQDDGFAELWGLQLGTADRAPVEMEFDSDDSSVLTDEEEEEEEEEEEQDVFELSDDDEYDDDEDDFDAFGDEGDEEGAWGE